MASLHVHTLLHQNTITIDNNRQLSILVDSNRYEYINIDSNRFWSVVTDANWLLSMVTGKIRYQSIIIHIHRPGVCLRHSRTYYTEDIKSIQGMKLFVV